MLIPIGILAGAGASADYELITTNLVTGSSVASVVFNNSSAWAAYKHLQIRWTGTEVSGGDIDTLFIRFNGDTGSNYAWHQLSGINSSAGAAGGGSTIYGYGAYITGLGNASAKYGAGIIDILDFASTNKTKVVRSLSGALGTTDRGVALRSNLWNNTSAVTSITLFGASGNIDINSRFSLYGFKG